MLYMSLIFTSRSGKDEGKSYGTFSWVLEFGAWKKDEKELRITTISIGID